MLAPHPFPSPPPQRRLLLAGGGHSHALLLRMWAMQPQRRPLATAITLVNRSGSSLYSGMVPGLVRGMYGRRQCAIDLRWLCQQAGVRFVQAEITGLDRAGRQLLLRDRPALAYEWLSLDVGAITAGACDRAAGQRSQGPGDRPTAEPAPGEGSPADTGSDPAGGGLAVKPLEPFLAWCASLPPGPVLRLRGGGAAAVELALALVGRGHRCELLLRGQSLHLGSAAANRAGEQLLARAGIPIRRGVDPATPADLLCTGSRAPAWLAAAGLPVDPASGRVLTSAALQVCGHPELFASGDCGLIATDPRPPSGVWAVRAAPVLAANLQRALTQPPRPLRPWHPQRWALQLLADGSKAVGGEQAGEAPRFQALALWGPFALGPHPWLGRWKDWIDRTFMARLGAAPLPEPRTSSGKRRGPAERSDGANRPAVMACRGCAAKLAAAPLAAALARLDRRGDAPAAEDAVPVATLADGRLLLQSVDGFPALVEDPWLNARLTTLHACSDLWASGARVESVQTLVTIPEAAAPLQEEWLYQTLAGVRSVLDPLGAHLLGGHTMEGRDGAGLALALTVQGAVAAQACWPKGPLRAGDALLLSRPLGSGVLLAAAMAGAADPQHIDALLEALQQSQATVPALLAAWGCQACTDVTGFGLLGHLGEMLAVSPAVTVDLDAAAIPAWPGALELLQQGYASTLAPANARALALLNDRLQLRSTACGASTAPQPTLSRPPSTATAPRPIASASPSRHAASRPSPPEMLATTDLQQARRELLLDPQTCGPLLAAVPAPQADRALQALRQAGFDQAARIGTVQAAL